MVSRCDFYSDEDYEYAVQLEQEEFFEQLAKEEEYRQYCEEEYRRECLEKAANGTEEKTNDTVRSQNDV